MKTIRTNEHMIWVKGCLITAFYFPSQKVRLLRQGHWLTWIKINAICAHIWICVCVYGYQIMFIYINFASHHVLSVLFAENFQALLSLILSYFTLNLFKCVNAFEKLYEHQHLMNKRNKVRSHCHFLQTVNSSQFVLVLWIFQLINDDNRAANRHPS